MFERQFLLNAEKIFATDGAQIHTDKMMVRKIHRGDAKIAEKTIQRIRFSQFPAECSPNS
jgi:hypothetical protein